MNHESAQPEVKRTDRQIYSPVIDRCNELFTLVETNFPTEYHLRLVDTTPGVWESYGAAILADGLSIASTIVVKDPLHPHQRVTISEVTRTEAEVNDIEINARLLIITRRHYPPVTSPLLCEQRILTIAPFFASACIMNFTETELPTGIKKADVINYFFDHETKLEKAEQAEFEATLDSLAQIRPIYNNGEISYFSSFDALSQGNRDKIVAGRMKEGLNKDGFVRDTLSLLQGEPVPITRFDLETEADQYIQKLLASNAPQHPLLVIPRNGYPDLPE